MIIGFKKIDSKNILLNLWLPGRQTYVFILCLYYDQTWDVQYKYFPTEKEEKKYQHTTGQLMIFSLKWDYKELNISKFLSSLSEDTPIETAKFIAKNQTNILKKVKLYFQET